MNIEKLDQANHLVFRIKQLEFFKEYLKTTFAYKPFNISIRYEVLGCSGADFIHGLNGAKETREHFIYKEDSDAILRTLQSRIDKLKKELCKL